MSVTIKDVAKHAGVSIATVSRCFNNTGYVSENASKVIRKAAEELNFSQKKYRPRAISKSSSNVIGIILTEYDNPFFSAVVSAVQKIAEKNGKYVMICNSRESSSLELMYLELLRSRVGGLIIAPASQVAYDNAQYLKDLNTKVMPVMLLDREVREPQLDGVFVDSFRGAYDGVQALIDNGHKEIAIVAGPTTSKPGLERLNGYLEALKYNSIPIKEEYILYGEFKESLAYSLTKKLLNKQKDVTAIFASNINMSFGCIKAIFDEGLKIPEDIAYLCFDDFPLFNMNSLRLSVIFNPAYQMGEEAAKWLISRMDRYSQSKTAPARRMILMPQLILRGSEKFPATRKNLE